MKINDSITVFHKSLDFLRKVCNKNSSARSSDKILYFALIKAALSYYE